MHKNRVKIAEYLCESLKDCLVDDDPYVKKTAAISVAKIYSIMPEHTKEFGFIKLLQELLQDGNAIVVANAAASLYEISKVAGKSYLKANKETIGNLLNALNDTNEWGQIYILEGIVNYNPKEDSEAKEIIERILPRLQHANPAVVLGATKNILHFLKFVDADDKKDEMMKKLSAPLITLLAGEAEIQYIALWNILIILRQIPNIFEKNVKMFFCRFSDPLYVKLSKVDVMVAVADSANVDLIISEFHEYWNDIDQDIVRRSVRAIGQVVCKIERVAKKGIEALRETITHEHGSDEALQEAVIVACKIMRKYPKKNEALVKDIMNQMRRIDEPESKSAFIWILGEYAHKIDDAEEKIQYFVSSFADQSTPVRLQILTSAVKMYIKYPEECEEMVMHVLHLASEVSDNPDLRDRGYIYWRMLSTDPTRTKDVVMTKRPEFSEDLSNLMDENTLEIFTDFGIEKSTHSALNPQKSEEPQEVESDSEPDEDEVKPKKIKKDKKEKKKKKEDTKEEVETEEVVETSKPDSGIEDIFGFDLDKEPDHSTGTANVDSDPLADIFGDSSGISGATPAQSSWENDIFGGGSAQVVGSDAAIFIKPEFSEVLSGSTPGSQKNLAGLQVKARFYRDDLGIKLDLVFYNSTANTLSDFEILFNKNSFGLKPTAINIIPLAGGQTFNTTVDCLIDQENADMKNPPTCPFMVQTAIKCSLDVYYFQVPWLLHVLFQTTPVSVNQTQWVQMANSIANKNMKSIASARFAGSFDDLKTRFGCNSIYHIYDEAGSMIFATSTINNVPILLRWTPEGSSVQIISWTPVGPLYSLIDEALELILTN